ncbi:MAG: glycosyltransferase family 39 protein [Anaerolineae bacterium]
MTARQRGWLVAILLLAFALRVYRLDAQSIWYDEGLSIYLAQQPVAQAVSLSATTDHPPLHTLALGGWIALTGDSDFAVRFLSLLLGVLAVALTYALGAQFDQRAGLFGAGLLALSPLAVYYSQEARDYTLLLALTMIATVAFVHLLRGDQRRRIWVAYVASMIAALYTHYFAVFTWAAINGAWLVVEISRTGIKSKTILGAAVLRWLLWFAAQIFILLAFLPWLPNALAQAGSNATYFPGRVTWQTVFGDTWRAFSVGEWGDASFVGWLWLAVILIGLTASLRGVINHAEAISTRDNKIASLSLAMTLLLSLLIAPLVAMSALAWLKPKFAPRYLLPSLPAWVLLASIGITRLIDGTRGRFCRLASIGVVVSLLLPLGDSASLLRLYTDSSLARPDVRSVAQYIEANAEPSDAILLIGGHQAPAFTHYFRGPAEVIPLPPDLLPAAQSPLDARALRQLADIAAQHDRVWLVLWQNEISDPTNVILDALMEQGRRLSIDRNFHSMSVLLFDVKGITFEAKPQFVTDDTFSEPLKLVGYNVNSSPITIDTPLRFGLYLEATGRIDNNYQIFTHLVDASGALIAQADHIAGADSYPTSLWRPGNLFLNRFEIVVPMGTAPGEYRVVVGLYDSIGRLKLADGGDQINLFPITLNP